MTEDQKPKDISFDDLKTEFAFELPKELETPKLPEPIVEATEEESEVEEQEVVTEEKEVVEAPKASTVGTYDKVVKTFLEKGEWEDAVIQTEDGEIKISELKDISEEEFLNLIEDQKSIKDQDTKEKYLPVEGLADDKKLIIDIVAKGGNLKEIFKDPSELVKPFSEEQGWDINNEEHQMQIVYNQYKRQGHSDSEAKLLLDNAIKDMSLDAKAQNIVEYYQNDYTEKLKKISADLETEQKAEIERVKNYRSELSKIYKEASLPESQIKKLVDLATKPTQSGSYTIDDMYEKVMEDPKQAQELIFFLADKEKYLQEKMKQTKIQTQVQNMRVINRIPKESVKKTATEEEAQKSSGFVFELPTS